MPRERLRVLTWHVHGNYLYYLTQAPHEFFVVTDAARSPGYSGLGGTLPWGGNVHEAALERLHQARFDCVLYQSPRNYRIDRLEQLSDAQRQLPAIYLEHDPPQEHPTNTRHVVDDSRVLLVHVTHFNRLMWDSGRCSTRVIEHGVCLPRPARYSGELARGIVVVNHLPRRVEVDRLDHLAACRLAAGRLDVGVVEAEHRCHGAGAERHGALHSLAAEPHQLDRGAEVDRSGTDQSRVLTEAVARHRYRHRAIVRAPGAPHRDACGQHCRLGPLSGAELGLGALLGQHPQVVAEHLRGFLEGLADHRLGGAECR